jgi:3-oxoacyl-[acyl-carrier-protein] synthase II
MTGRRVAITGLGVLSPHGSDPAAMFDALMRGESAVRRTPLESGTDSFVVVAAAVRGEPWASLPRSQRVMTDRVSQYALLATSAAIIDSGLDLEREDRQRVGAAFGTCMGGITTTENAYEDLFRRGMTRVSPFTLVKTMYNAPTAQVCLQYGLAGPSLTFTTTCSSSAVAVGEAMRTIRHGYADVMIAGGAEALLVYGSVKAWVALQILAPERADDPAATCRPFSRDRNGTVIGDGAAIVVLEAWEHAVARGARIYAELAGYGVCNDSAHMTQPSIEGQAHAMRLALADAQVAPEEIGYINAHGTATQLNDVTETRAIKETFGRHAARLAVSSTKSMHGHLVGAAGAMELVISTLAVVRQQAPPTAHLDVVDPDCDLDYVPHRGRAHAIDAAMTNSFAFGGTAGVLVVTTPRWRKLPRQDPRGAASDRGAGEDPISPGRPSGSQ